MGQRGGLRQTLCDVIRILCPEKWLIRISEALGELGIDIQVASALENFYCTCNLALSIAFHLLNKDQDCLLYDCAIAVIIVAIHSVPRVASAPDLYTSPFAWIRDRRTTQSAKNSPSGDVFKNMRTSVNSIGQTIPLFRVYMGASTSIKPPRRL